MVVPLKVLYVVTLSSTNQRTLSSVYLGNNLIKISLNQSINQSINQQGCIPFKRKLTRTTCNSTGTIPLRTD